MVKRIETVNNGNGWAVGDRERERLDELVDDWFFIRFFESLTDQPRMTAFQAREIIGEKAVLMGDLVNGYQRDFQQPAIKLQWAFETKAGRMPTPPDILLNETDGQVDIIFNGILAQLPKGLQQSKGIVNGLQFMGEVIAVNPSTTDIMD